MATIRFSFQKLAYALICLCIVLSVLYIGSAIFIPMTFGMLFAFMLKSVTDRIEKLLRSRVLAIVLTLLSVAVVIVSVFGFFVARIGDVLSEADNVITNLQLAWNSSVNNVGRYFGMTSRESSKLIDEGIMTIFKEPLSIVSSGLSASGVVLGNFFLSILYTFFFLLYRTAFKRFLMGQFGDASKAEGEITIKEIQYVATDYLTGMLIVMLVLGVLNSVGLYLIGIQYPLVWGFLGALLAVIPYVGTALGGLLPFLYAIATTATIWQPVAVVVLYASVQFIEGNLITPKIVGNSVKINALAAVVALIFGVAFWGLAGLILALPLLAMVRIIMEHIRPLKPVALLLSDDLYRDSGKFLDDYCQPEYRLSSLFTGKNIMERNVTRLRRPVALGEEPRQQARQADTEVIADAEAQQGNSNPSREQTLIP